MNKNKNESSDRNRLNQEGSLSAILAVKLDSPEEKVKCFNFQLDKVLLDQAKKVTMSYNEEHVKNIFLETFRARSVSFDSCTL